MKRYSFAAKVVTVLQYATIATCAKLLSGGTIIAFDQEAEQLEVIRGGSILIEGDQITSVFDTASPSGIPSGTEVVDCTNQIITPGFVDTHRHGWQTVFKTMGPDITLAQYAFRYSSFAAAPSLFTPDDVYISQLAGIHEAVAAGVTTMLDHAHHTWTPEHAAAGVTASVDSGARVFFGYTFHSTQAGFGVPEQIAQWKELASATSDSLTELVVAYDEFAADPAGKNTQAVVDLLKSVPGPNVTEHAG